PKEAGAILAMLQEYRSALELLEQKQMALTAELEQASAARNAPRPKGMGELTAEQIDREVVDWRRFANRRQVASYTGLCPGVSGSGGRFRGLSINKHGNPALRA